MRRSTDERQATRRQSQENELEDSCSRPASRLRLFRVNFEVKTKPVLLQHTVRRKKHVSPFFLFSFIQRTHPPHPINRRKLVSSKQVLLVILKLNQGPHVMNRLQVIGAGT
ncbi:hypothetical protein C0Q70_02560 [Pomacea canaliculata]|uniref:Uncharacterized protein n=1 Tax=Pomacea canaliculata TaxID=400727 RepID=A0A2T7PQE8_POMCA|nr:hypothetical protein C0Q70_02560 [Pomacea canaliculata]